MTFNSGLFIPFLLVVMTSYYLITRWTFQKLLLVIASYAFYGFFKIEYVPLLFGVTLFTWFAARFSAGAKEKNRRYWVLLGVGAPIVFLGYFKYFNLLQSSSFSIAEALGFSPNWTLTNVFLPIGISFYLFHTISYVVDVSKGKVPPTTSFLDYNLYVTFFPQLVAGPIVRSVVFLPQCLDRSLGEPDWRKIGWGLSLFIVGLFQKVILADKFFAPAAETAFSHARQLSTSDAWIGSLAFSGQILSDFAGYSTCAIGISLCFGFRLPLNFRYPYASLGFSDFWRRWHISLSSWLRDYLYIPLGGNRHGPFQTYRNLMLTMLIGGLWHGAAWTFVFWGGLHGLYLVGERLLRQRFGEGDPKGIPSTALAWVATFVLTVVAWVFFRADSFEDAAAFLSSMAGFGLSRPSWLAGNSATLALVGIGGLLLYSWYMRERSFAVEWSRAPRIVRPVVLAATIVTVIFWQGASSEFIYFRF